MLPAEHQRLVKYPLMLEQLAKQCEKVKSKEKTKTDEASSVKDPSLGLQNENVDKSGEGEATDRTNKISSASSTDIPKSPSSEDRDQSAFLVESALIKKFVDRTRDIVETIDKQVAEAQNIQRLAEIQQDLDLSGLEKFPDSPITIEYRVSTRIRCKLLFVVTSK